MRSIDVIFDESLEAAVRTDWGALSDAGLPSLTQHRGASNRPHITVAAGNELTLDGHPSFEAFAVRLGAVMLFPRKSGFVLARSVVATSELLALHRSVHSLVAGAVDHTRVGCWSPHVTLSRNLTAQQLETALQLLGAPRDGMVSGIRLWDSVTATVTELTADDPTELA
ncbi:2'-5' RNA ligase superfamily protein [Glaciihabitans tibetensis]|uniref:2'-5' RNA ligase superfamily protein n=1 Tax=Glaciihabitans tibetensis TaxID=1266600 RepID=A0A2T0VK53_9MICO|nr:2'-5' RNA ligase family protein [Glaciihabitans tibetensis]PRY70569.1 2'-5' RNA ligase superfamily protein [Glaciihabitans tibetensis]